MKKVLENKIFLVNAIAAIVLICVFFYFMSGKETVEKNPAQTTDCASIQSNYLKDACYFEIAVKNSDSDKCSKVIDSDQKDLCYFKVALATKDKEICEFIFEKFYMKPRCYAEISNIKTGQLN